MPFRSTALLRRASRRRARALIRMLAVPLALLGLLAALVLPVSVAAAAPATVSPGSEIEVLSPYQGATVCEPVARPGVVAFRDLVLAAYPGTSDAGITRSCATGGNSEHKEGRAWDWRVSTADPAQVAQVDDLMDWLLAPDEHGNLTAMARRLGVMYVIWDARIWKSYQASRGWQPYSGSNPHTDHVHVSFSWAGALHETSYWTGRVAPVMSRPVAPSPSPTSDTATATVSPSPTATPSPARTASPSSPPGPTASPSAPALDPRAQIQRRRTLVKNLPGPWRRH